MNKHLFVLFLVSVVILSGCTGRSGGSGNGAVIETFSINPNFIYEGESAYVELLVRNAGSKTMPGDSILWIYGPDFQNTWRAYGDIAPATRGGVILQSQDFLPNEYFEAYGDIEYIGDVPEGLGKSQEHTFYARLCYPYFTSSDSVIVFQSRNEARVVSNTAEQSTINSRGPIQAQLVRPNGNVVTVRGTGNAVSVGGTLNINLGSGGRASRLTLPFIINNVGNGFPTADGNCALGPDVGIEDQDTVLIRLIIDGADYTSSCNKNIVKLRNGQGRVNCGIDNIDLSDPSRQYHINLEMYYDYYITKTQTVKVEDSTYY